MFSWICSKCGNTQDIFKVCKCGNTYKEISSFFIYTDQGIESLNLQIGSHTEVTIDGKIKEPQRNEDFRVTKEDENVYI